MKSVRARWVVVTVLAVAAFAGGLTAAAQEGPDSPEGTPGVDLSFDAEARLTPTEQIAWAEEKQGSLFQTREYATRLLSQARQEDRPDIIKINCINNKLMEINAQIQSYEERTTSLREAIALNDNDRRLHEYRVLVVVYQKVQSLRMEVDACIGEEMIGPGSSRTTMLRDGTEVEVDLTEVEIPEPLMDRPPHASGYY